MNINISFKRTGGPYGDATSNYDVQFHQTFTVRDFILHILHNKGDEWGYFIIERERVVEYSHGRLIELLNGDLLYKNLDENVVKITASGGWTRMDYIIYVESKEG